MQIKLKLVPALAVVLTRPVDDHYAQAMYSIENGVNTYFQSFPRKQLNRSLSDFTQQFPTLLFIPSPSETLPSAIFAELLTTQVGTVFPG